MVYIFYKGRIISEQTVNSPNHPEALRLKQEWKESQKNRIVYSFDSPYSSSYRNRLSRQTTIECDGYTFDVSYTWDGKPYICIEPRMLFNVESKTLKLDNGTCVSIRCGMHTSNNFPALREKFERERVSRCWDSIKSNLPTESSAKMSVISAWLPEVGQIEVTRANNSTGEVIMGYVFLKLVDKKVKLEVSANEEEAIQSTNEALRFLFGREIQEKYSEKKFQVKIGGKTILTKKGKEAKELFDDFVRDSQSSLQPDTFVETLQSIADIFNEIQQEYLG